MRLCARVNWASGSTWVYRFVDPACVRAPTVNGAHTSLSLHDNSIASPTFASTTGRQPAVLARCCGGSSVECTPACLRERLVGGRIVAQERRTQRRQCSCRGFRSPSQSVVTIVDHGMLSPPVAGRTCHRRVAESMSLDEKWCEKGRHAELASPYGAVAQPLDRLPMGE